MKLNFNIFKNDHKSKDNHPDSTISTFNAESQERKKVGACWIKSTKSGVKFMSCQYNDEYTAPETPSVNVEAFDKLETERTDAHNIPF